MRHVVKNTEARAGDGVKHVPGSSTSEQIGERVTEAVPHDRGLLGGRRCEYTAHADRWIAFIGVYSCMTCFFSLLTRINPFP